MSTKKKIFNLPYSGIDTSDPNIHMLFGEFGQPSIVIGMVNKVTQYSANPESYLEYHNTMLNIIKILGEDYFLQKLDIFSKSNFKSTIGSTEYLQKKYDEHFEGRIYTRIETYLVITRQTGRKLPTEKELADFKHSASKILQLLTDFKYQPILLRETAIERLLRRILSMDFESENIVLDNLVPNDYHIRIGEKTIKILSLIDIDNVDLPEKVSPFTELNNNEALKGFPVDTMAFLHTVPEYETLIYHQVIEIPKQIQTQKKLELKKKRHSAFMIDPSNEFSAQDIQRLLEDVARENHLLVNAHFSIIISSKESKLAKAINYVESSLFQQGIIPSKNSYNQLELFRAALIGNSVGLKHYDLYLTTANAALTFFFKESLPIDEPSPKGFFLRFTDRQGIPKKIDPADYSKEIGRINNTNKFLIGPSGSGKSFCMNAIVEQYMLYNMDIVIIDTGDSYSGTCSYYGGKYITYTNEKPVTMNPFVISETEYNLEKKDFLLTLVLLLWKGAEGAVSAVDNEVISKTIAAYYKTYFSQDKTEWLESLGISELELYLLEEFAIDPGPIHERVLKELSAEQKWFKNYYEILAIPYTATQADIKSAFRRLAHKFHPDKNPDENNKQRFTDIAEAYEILSSPVHKPAYDTENNIGKLMSGDKAWKEAPSLEASNSLYKVRLKETIQKLMQDHRIPNLSFNSFYDFAVFKIPIIKRNAHIPFDLDEFKFILKKFYKGGEFESILNEDADKSLFTERLIIYEIDNIKENKVLFPIVVLIVMDVFLQKMRFRQHQRKVLIIEEAWKAIASPIMASYILYLYKTVRKFAGEAVVVTQELEDILGNPIVKNSIVNNSDTILLLDQTKFKDNYEEIASLLSINPVEKRKIFTINNLDNKENRGKFKEVYIRRGSEGEVYGVEVSFAQYLTYTTEKPEKLAVQAYATQYGSYPSGIDHFVDDLKTSTLTLSQFVDLVNNFMVPDSDTFEVLRYYKQTFGSNGYLTFKKDFQSSGQSLPEFLSFKLNTVFI